jgi:hypothetical protein
MSDIEVFEIDDQFDPLAEMVFDDETAEQETDYLPPIPDAELSRVPRPTPLTPRQRIEALLAGIPGQKFRILCAAEICAEPHTREEVAAELDARFPDDVSVYDSAQIVRLLERAGALELCETPAKDAQDAQGQGAAGAAPDGDGDENEDEGAGFRSVAPRPEHAYRTTAAGLEALAENVGSKAVLDTLSEDRRYLPLFRRILELSSAEGGCTAKELDAAIDPDPLCENPRRFCGYFLGRLENAGAIRWQGTWSATDEGREALASDIFND